MIKKILKNSSNYLFLIIFNLALFLIYQDTNNYLTVKYIITNKSMDIMISIIFTFLLLKLYFDSYYYIVLNRNNIITRIGRKKYNLLILKQLLIPSIIFFIINFLTDYILIGSINIIYIIINILCAITCVIALPKKKEYNNEFLIVLILFILIKIVYFKLFILVYR